RGAERTPVALGALAGEAEVIGRRRLPPADPALDGVVAVLARLEAERLGLLLELLVARDGEIDLPRLVGARPQERGLLSHLGRGDAAGEPLGGGGRGEG